MVSIVTYNVWFSEFLYKERMLALHKIISKYNPEIVCFQEVRKNIYNEFKQVFNDYKFYPEDLQQQYDCCILVKKDNKNIIVNEHLIIPYELSLMMRNLQVIKCLVNNKEYIIGNTHFESLFDNNDERIKIKYIQYNQCKNILEAYGNNIILCCDSNLTQNDETIFNSIYHNWRDCWVEYNEKNKKINYGFTYNTKTNPYLRKKSIEIISRIDRIMMKSNNLSISNIELLNRWSSPFTDKEPSDHYGIIIFIVYTHS
jgi:hypothetical protein